MEVLAGSIGAAQGPRLSPRAAVATIVIPAVCAALALAVYGHELALHSWPPPFTLYVAAGAAFGLGYPAGGALRGVLYGLLAAAVTYVLIGAIVIVQLMLAISSMF